MVRGTNRGLRPPTEDRGINGLEHCQGRHPAERPFIRRASVTVEYFKTTRTGSMLRQRLNTPMPMHREIRTGFIARFRAAVDWLNAHRSELLTQDCTIKTARPGTVM